MIVHAMPVWKSAILGTSLLTAATGVGILAHRNITKDKIEKLEMQDDLVQPSTNTESQLDSQFGLRSNRAMGTGSDQQFLAGNGAMQQPSSPNTSSIAPTPAQGVIHSPNIPSSNAIGNNGTIPVNNLPTSPNTAITQQNPSQMNISATGPATTNGISGPNPLISPNPQVSPGITGNMPQLSSNTSQIPLGPSGQVAPGIPPPPSA